MSKSLFIELWAGLRDLMGDNNTAGDINDAKRFINWTMADLANEYDWEFLRGEQSITATAGSSVYDLSQINQLTATSETLYVFSDASADDGSVVTIYGKQIAASSTLNISSDPITIIGTATATGGIAYSHIDSIRKNTTNGSVTVVTSTGGAVATLTANETYISNDLNKINFVVDTTNDKRIIPYDRSTYERGNPDGSNLGSYSGYDIDHEGKLRLFNVDANTILNVIYQRIPRWLINDSDRSEFPRIFDSKIINAAYEGYGLRYRDQQDAQIGKQRYKALLQDIVESWVSGKDTPRQYVMPSWYKRRI